MNLLHFFRKQPGNLPEELPQTSEAERLLRTPKAGSQLSYVLDQLASGKKVSSLSVFMGAHSVSPTMRISEARKVLNGMGITLYSEWLKRDGVRYKRFHLEKDDAAKLRHHLRVAWAPSVERRSRVRGGRS